MRYIQYAWLALFLPSISFGAIDLDVDKNGATDVNRGGSNATTAAGARSNLGLGNVTNTSDANKPVSTAQQSALDLKSNITCFANASAFNTCFGLDWITAAGIGLGTTDSPAFTGLTLGIANTSFGTLGFYGNSKTYPFSLWSDGADVGSLGWKLPSTLPSTASLISSSTLGYLSYVDPATFLTPTGVGGALTVTATGFDGNLTTSDNTLQEIAQKVDDLVLGSGGGYSNLTEFVAQTAWRLFYSDGSGDVKELSLGSDGEYLKSNGAALAPSWSTPSGAAHDAVTLGTDAAAILGLSTQEITLDSQTANYFFAAPNGSAGDPTFRALVAADIPTLNQNTTGSAATLATARTIGGVSFNGSANINLPGVNTSGTQNTSGTAAGLSGTPNITVGTISAGAAGFAVNVAGDATAKSFSATRTTSPQALELYEGTGGGSNKVTIAPSATLAADKYIVAESLLQTTDVDDTPVNGVTDAPVSSNWAYDHAASATAHGSFQAADADLTTWAGVTPSTNGQSLVAAANYAAMRTLLDLEVGTDFNAYDADLDDLADGSLTASKVAGSSFDSASKATTYTIGTDSANESYGGTVYVTSATTITAPAVITGMNFAVVTIGDIAVSLDVNASDRMILDGVTLADGDRATNSSKAGDTIVCQYYSADGWYCWSSTVLGGHWTDGN